MCALLSNHPTRARRSRRSLPQTPDRLLLFAHFLLETKSVDITFEDQDCPQTQPAHAFEHTRSLFCRFGARASLWQITLADRVVLLHSLQEGTAGHMINNHNARYGIVSFILTPALDHGRHTCGCSRKHTSENPTQPNKQTNKQPINTCDMMRSMQYALCDMPRMCATRATAAGGHSQACCGRLRVRPTIATAQ